jgi:predicted AlkP superfamily phosphohydrolase/phosphomutase
MADRYGVSSNVFGWWITWPVEEIRGIMVSGSSSSALVDANWKPTLLPDAERQVHPASMNKEIMAIAERAGRLDEVQRLAREKVFGDIPDSLLGAVEKRLIKETLWSVQSDATYYEVARAMIRAHPADLNLVYFGGTDVVGHRFWRYYEPAPFTWPGDPKADAAWKQMAPDSEPLSKILAGPEGMHALSRVIPNYYEWFDEMLGGLMEAAGPDAIVIVLSDHGMHAHSTERPNSKFVTGHHLDGAPGVIIAAGPSIVRQGNADAFLAGKAASTHGNILQFAPTLLALLGIPSSTDMPAKADVSLLEGKARANAGLAMIASHDAGFRTASKVEVPKAMRDSFIDRFNGLGYIGIEGSEERGSKIVDPENFTPDTKSSVDDGTGEVKRP